MNSEIISRTKNYSTISYNIEKIATSANSQTQTPSNE